MRLLPIIALVIASVSFSDIETQTDWSGGGGVVGPVTEWENTYSLADQIDDTVSCLRLISSNPVKYFVDENFDRANSVYSADIDLDGDNDILGAAQDGNEFTWWENVNGDGTDWTERLISGNFYNATVVFSFDIDDDGDADVIGGGYDDVIWWENQNGLGTDWLEHLIDDDFDGVASIYVVDIDSDGDCDVIGCGSSGSCVAWWENTVGDGSIWSRHIIDGYFNHTRCIHYADLDLDGDPDVLGVSPWWDEVAWWENIDGLGTIWTKHTIDQSFDFASSVFAYDMDGDGDDDVLGAAWSGDEISWWENLNGLGTSWTKHIVDTDFDAARSVYACDLDNDGDADIAGAAAGCDEISWWENLNGLGTSWTKHIIAEEFDGACSVYLEDVNGDDYLDVLGAAWSDEISWWDIIAVSPQGVLESSILDVATLDTWLYFSSNEEEPSGTSIGFQFRSSNDSSDMGEWSDTSFTLTTNLSGILADSTNFVQYRAILQTTDPFSTPVLNNVTIFYITYVSIDDANHEEISNWNLSPVANPSYGSPAIQVSVPQSEVLDLLLYDATGRLVGEHSQELTTGQHTISFNNLSSGVYFCTVRAGDFNATERIIVLEQNSLFMNLYSPCLYWNGFFYDYQR